MNDKNEEVLSSDEAWRGMVAETVDSSYPMMMGGVVIGSSTVDHEGNITTAIDENAPFIGRPLGDGYVFEAKIDGSPLDETELEEDPSVPIPLPEPVRALRARDVD